MTRRMVPWLVALVVCVGLTPRAHAEVAYGPVPPALLEAEVTPEDAALAAAAIDALETTDDTDLRLDARATLAMVGDGGLLEVAKRLAAGNVPDALLPHLLHVAVGARHPAADEILTHAAEEGRASLRAMAAEGLGRGRTAGTVEVLARLAVDPAPSVRGTALRALFAIDREDAIAARQALPVDARPDLHARRLRWHYLRGRSNPSLRPMALETWREGRTPTERTWAARLLGHPTLAAPLPVLQAIIAEMGTDAFGASLTRLAMKVPRRGYDGLEMRLAAILAAYTGIRYATLDDALHQDLVEHLVEWLAHPLRMSLNDGRPGPEGVLRMALPDQGETVVEPTMARLLADRFHDPQDGVDLLSEALPPERLLVLLQRLIDPDANPPVPTSVRVAASGALRVARRIGDESLARRLIRPTEETVIRRDVIRALAGDDAAWAVPLLTEIVAAEDPVVSPDAVLALEQCPDERARPPLIEHLLTRTEHPQIRLDHLLAPADDQAFDVLERALTHKRSSLRSAALSRMHEVPSLRGERALALLRTYRQRIEGDVPDTKQGRNALTHEVQQVLYAYFALAPLEGLAWMREHWSLFVALDWEGTAIKSLQNAKGDATDAAVVDLVLERFAGEADPDPELLIMASIALEGRRGHRREELDAFWMRLLTHADENVVWSAVYSLEHPGRGDLLDALLPLYDARDASSMEHFAEIGTLLEVFEHQPWPRIEPRLADLALDERASPDLRRQAVMLLEGRVTPQVRTQLLAWLTAVDAEQQDVTVALVVARVVGKGGGEAVATACYDALVKRLDRAFASDRATEGAWSGPNRQGEEGWLAAHEQAWPLRALGSAVAYTGHAPTIARTVECVFDVRLARYARTAVGRQGVRLGPVDATAGGRRGPGLRWVRHRHDARHMPVPWEIALVVDSLKAASDETLAAAFETSVAAARATGRLAAFPDLYLDRLIASLREKSTGDRAAAADVLGRAAAATEPSEGATDFGLAFTHVTDAERGSRYAEAAEAASTALGILSRRAYDDDAAWNWRKGRAVLEAWRGAAEAADGRREEAEATIRRAVAINPYDSTILQTAARARARTGLDLDAALALAIRAFVLDRRVRHEKNFEVADTLALVHLSRGSYLESARSIEPMLRRAYQLRWPGGRHHLRYAEALAHTERLDEAARALLVALELEPSLDEVMRTDPHLEALRANGRLERVIREAEDAALHQQLTE